MDIAYQSFKERYAFFAWALLLILSIISGLLVLEWAEDKRFQENQRRSVVEQLSTIRAKLEGELNAELLLARSLITEVVTNEDISKDRFSKIAKHFMGASKHIRNIGLAKGTVLTFVYPIKNNEKAIGFDYSKNALQWPAVERVIEGRKTVVAGPLNLVQGGVGIIGRTPIFIATDNADSVTKKYFGLLSVVINQPSLLEAAGFGNKNIQLDISIRGKDGLGAKGEVFYGREELFLNDPVLLEVTLPGEGHWLMAATPVNGWNKSSPNIIYYRIAGIVVGLVILFLLLIQQREIRSRRRGEEGRRELIKELQAALSDVKQLSGLLPICANCKKVRDDKGYWNRIETYIQERSDAKFSHGICKECMKKLYPGLKASKD